MNKVILFLLLFCSFAYSVQSLGISGQSMKIMIDHVPGYTREDTYYITNNEGYTSTYTITPTNEKGSVPPGSLIVTPSRLENVMNGETRPFTVKVLLPDEIPTVGQNEVWVQAMIDSSGSGVIKAYPSVAIRYVIFVLYPEKYPRFEFYAPSMNENETKEILININNLGKPTIETAKAVISIYNLENDALAGTLETSVARDIASRETKTIAANFDSTGNRPGNYRAAATVYWDNNATELEQFFRIGTNNVNILDFQKLFEYNAINRMDISVESAWNTKISNIQAEIIIYDKDTQKKLKSFRSFPTDLEPWEKKALESYFDTMGLEKKEYLASVTLNYEDRQTSAEAMIRIDEDINAVVVEEIPGTLSIKSLVALITPVNILVLLIIIFLIVNAVLIYDVVKKKPKKALVDEAAVNKVIALLSQYEEEHIKEMLIKKGWHEEEARIIIAEAKKRAK